jgi:perosamine synthetase
MKQWKIPLYRIHTSVDDVKSVSNIVSRDMGWAIGPEIEEFEEKLAKYVKSGYCVSFNSGTSAQHASLLALGIKFKDEVIVPSFTFISTANSVLMANGKPVFSDIEENSLGLDPELIKKNISQYTKAIMPVHYAGGACRIKEICELTHKKKIHVIEDAAESLGCKIGKKKIGTFGSMGIFSFAGNKVLTTGEGGAVVTNSKKLYEKLKLIRSHGRLDKKNYFQSNLKSNYITLGYNWRMSSMTAALAKSQLKRLDKMIQMRRKNAIFLSSKLKEFEEVIVPMESGYKHVFQLYSIRLKNKKVRNALMEFLSQNGIMSKIYFEPVHKTPFYTKLGYSKINLPVTKKVSEQILSLPMFPDIKTRELKLIVETIGEFIKNSNITSSF